MQLRRKKIPTKKKKVLPSLNLNGTISFWSYLTGIFENYGDDLSSDLILWKLAAFDGVKMDCSCPVCHENLALEFLWGQVFFFLFSCGVSVLASPASGSQAMALRGVPGRWAQPQRCETCRDVSLQVTFGIALGVSPG